MNASKSILKSLWNGNQNTDWGITDIKGLTLNPQDGFGSDYFAIEDRLELMTQNPRGRSIQDLMHSFGSTNFLLKQSIVPVVAYVEGENIIRTIGTAFIISCTGYLITACHVLIDPMDRNYGQIVREGNSITFSNGLHMGVLIPTNPASGVVGNYFCEFEHSWYWGEWVNSPLIHEDDTFDILTDVAICKIPMLPNECCHQPLNLSLNSFSAKEETISIGYAGMDDIKVEVTKEGIRVPEINLDLYVSVGQVKSNFPNNHNLKEVPTPGPCFDFEAKVPGKMSGGPIFGADGAVVRGVVSRSFSGEKHAYGAMVGPAMNLPINADSSLKEMMNLGSEGIAKIEGVGL